MLFQQRHNSIFQLRNIFSQSCWIAESWQIVVFVYFKVIMLAGHIYACWNVLVSYIDFTENESAWTDPIEELLGWQNNFNDHIAGLRQNQMATQRELKDAEEDVRKLSDQHSRNCTLQGKLQAEVEVCSAMRALLCLTV